MIHAVQFALRARLVLAVVVAGAPLQVAAQTQVPEMDRMADSVRVVIETAVNSGDVQRMDAAIALSERAFTASPRSSLLQHYRAYALYRAASVAIGQANNASARRYLDLARTYLEPLVKTETIPESYALLSAVYGLQIGVSRVRMIAGIQLGSKSKAMMDSALARAPDNARVVLLNGINLFNTPSSFGGGIDKAQKQLERAIVLLSSEHSVPPMPAWGAADAHIWLGQVYARQHKRDAARLEYNVALQLQPQNKWITEVLLPALGSPEL